MHAFIVIAQNKEDRNTYIDRELKKLGISPFDRIYPDTESNLGIKDIRQFIKHLSINSSSEVGKAGIIIDGDTLSPESQHALLKTLEEPPPKTIIYIGISNSSFLLPAILSRGQIIDISQTYKITDEEMRIEFVKKIMNLKKGERILELSRIGKTREEYIEWVDSTIRALEEKKITEYSQVLRYLLRAKQYQNNNVHPLLFIEQAFLMV